MQTHYTCHTTPQPQLHYIATTTALHHTQSSSCGWGDHCNHRNHSNKHNSNHLSVNQWISSAIRDSQQPTSPIGFLFWNFRRRLVGYYWNTYIDLDNPPSIDDFLTKTTVFHWYIWVHVEAPNSGFKSLVHSQFSWGLEDKIKHSLTILTWIQYGAHCISIK